MNLLALLIAVFTVLPAAGLVIVAGLLMSNADEDLHSFVRLAGSRFGA